VNIKTIHEIQTHRQTNRRTDGRTDDTRTDVLALATRQRLS